MVRLRGGAWLANASSGNSMKDFLPPREEKEEIRGQQQLPIISLQGSRFSSAPPASNPADYHTASPCRLQFVT